MKQKLILICLTICFCLFAIEVRATSDSVQVWKNIQEKHLDQLVEAFKPQEWYDPQKGIATEGLAVNAYWLAADNDLLLLVEPENREIDRYKDLFKQENGLTGEYISVKQFFAQANNRGFFLPAATKQEDKFAQLQARMDQLETAAKTGDQQAKAELADFKSRLEQYDLKLDKLAGLQSVVRQLEETQAEHGQRLSRLSTKVTNQGGQMGKLQDFDRELSMQIALLESKLNRQQSELTQLRTDQQVGFSQLGSEVQLLKKVPGYGLVQSLGSEDLADAYNDRFYYLVIALALLILIVVFIISLFGNRPKPTQQGTANQPRSSKNVTSMSNHRRRAEKSRKRRAA